MNINDAVPAKAGILLPFIFAISLFLLPSLALADNGVSVLELYTTQGCSNCPAADRLMLDYARQPGLVAFACHVTYFDRPGAADPLAIKPCDDRQFAYKKSGVTGKVFTPQAVINGKSYTVGSRANAIRNALNANGRVPEIPVRKNGAYLDVDLPPMTLSAPAAIWILAIDNIHSVSAEGGENSGRTIAYANAVRYMTRLMDWNGRPVKMALPVDNIKVDGFIVLAQYADNTAIIAAGKTP